MDLLRFTPILLVLLMACGTNGRTSPPPSGSDTLWVGDLRITEADTLFIPCGTRDRYPIYGPAMEELTARYALKPWQGFPWLKTWVNGRLDPRNGSLRLYATEYVHFDANVRCPDLPDSSGVGSYLFRVRDELGARTRRINLFADGTAVRESWQEGQIGVAEDAGTWGFDNDGALRIKWDEEMVAKVFKLEEHRLTSPLDPADFFRDGSPKRLSGSFAHAARWVQQAANAHAATLDLNKLAGRTRLDTLLSPAVLSTLESILNDSLPVNTEPFPGDMYELAARVRAGYQVALP